MSIKTSRSVGVLFFGAALSAVGVSAFWMLHAAQVWSKARLLFPLCFASFIVFSALGVWQLLREKERSDKRAEALYQELIDAKKSG